MKDTLQLYCKPRHHQASYFKDKKRTGNHNISLLSFQLLSEVSLYIFPSYFIKTLSLEKKSLQYLRLVNQVALECSHCQRFPMHNSVAVSRLKRAVLNTFHDHLIPTVLRSSNYLPSLAINCLQPQMSKAAYS